MELCSPLVVFLGFVLFGGFLLTRFQVVLQAREEAVVLGLKGLKHLGHSQLTLQSAERRLEHFSRTPVAADGDPELVEIPSCERKTG